MRYTTTDGPITFGLADAAKIADISPARLRTYIHREFLSHVGQIPLAGQERRFSVSGLVEICLFSELLAFGAEHAKRITDQILGEAYAAGYLHYCATHPDFEGNKVLHPDANTRIADHMDSHPDAWLSLPPWADRDPSSPALLIFAMNDLSLMGPERARGWGNIEQARNRMCAEFAEANTLGGKAKPEVIQSVSDSWHLFHILNLTAIMVRIDKGIKAIVAERQPFRPDEAAAVGLTGHA